MTTTQLTKLKDAGFTLEQIIAIGGIFDTERPKPAPERPDELSRGQLKLIEEQRKAYEKGRKEAEYEELLKKIGLMLRNEEFDRRLEEFKQSHMQGLFLGPMESFPMRRRNTLGIGIQHP